MRYSKQTLTLTAALTFALCAQAQAEIVGVNAHLPSEEELDMAQALGVRWIRIDNNWFQIEPREGERQWAPLDRVVDGARRRGLAVMMTIAYTPAWASEGDQDGSSHNDTPRPGTFARFVEATVLRYRDRVTHFGVWNEPNLSQFWAGSRADYLERVLRPGAAAVRAACPECKVLGPDLAGLSNWQRALDEILTQAPGAFDILTHHTYAAAPGVRSVWLCDDLVHALDIGQDQICAYKPGLRQVLDQRGWSGEVWITETGYRANPWDDAQQQERQRATLEATLGLQRETPWWTATFFYELSDCGPFIPGCEIDGFGLARRTGDGAPSWEGNHVQKPAFTWLREALRDPYWSQDEAPPDVPADPAALDIPWRADGAPDAARSDWSGAGCAPLTRFESLTGAPTGADDLSARLCAAWSDGALWLSAEVRDDRHHNDQPVGTRWASDSLQAALDRDGDAAAGQPGYDDDDAEWTLALIGDQGQLSTEAGALRGATGAARRDGAVTRYELRVPLSGLSAGQTLRASLLINEDDGQGREGWLEWTPGIGRAKEPWRFGRLRLTPPPQPEEDAGLPDAEIAEDLAIGEDFPQDIQADSAGDLMADLGADQPQGEVDLGEREDMERAPEGRGEVSGEDVGLITQPAGGCGQAPGRARPVWSALAAALGLRIRPSRGR